jgi:glutathione synthase
VNWLKMLQVEVNIGQVGGPGCATAMTKLHKKMLEKAENLLGGPLASLATATQPENRPRRGMAETLYHAWKLFNDPKAVIVFMNQPDMFPVCHFEQLQFVQYEVEKLARKEGFHLNVMRMPISETPQRLTCLSLHLLLLLILFRLRLDETDFSLYADGNKRVALVHMAYGYLPDHYPTEKEWKTRTDMERSTAIISPDIRLSLAGSKKIQQVLAKPGVIEVRAHKSYCIKY